MKLSTYNTNDIEEIKQLFTKTFTDSEGDSEGKIIGDLAYDLMMTTDSHDLNQIVATENEKIVGSIIFSRLTFEEDKVNAFVMGPVAVHTDHQRKGIGQKLINYGINALKHADVELVFTYGDPNYYSKVCFKVISEELIKAPFKLSYPEGWMCQSLTSDEIELIAGDSHCVDALNKSKYW